MIYSRLKISENLLSLCRKSFPRKKVNIPIAQSTDSIYTNMHSANPRAVANASMKILDSLQNEKEDIQLAAAGVIMLILSRRFKIQPNSIFTCVDNLMRDSKRYDDATFRAVAEYFKNEL